jgi:hypothetical protein
VPSVSLHEDMGSFQHQSLWDLYWTTWYWDTGFLPVLRISLSVSFCQCSILTFTSYANNTNTAEREVNEIFLAIQKQTRASQKKVMDSCRQCREYEAHRSKLINTVRNGPEP